MTRTSLAPRQRLAWLLLAALTTLLLAACNRGEEEPAALTASPSAPATSSATPAALSPTERAPAAAADFLDPQTHTGLTTFRLREGVFVARKT